MPEVTVDTAADAVPLAHPAGDWPRLSYAQAVNAALDAALARFPEALVFGEDVALPGGVFGCTRGLQKKYGDRVFDTPISETGFLGAAVGAAMFGMRPIPEVMWVEFTLVALDQIVNQAPNVRYVSEGKLAAPLTVRTQQGILPGSCAQHSQSLEAYFTHCPGLRVAMPSTPADAYELLLAAIACEDPSIVIEHRSLYPTTGPVPVGAPPAPIGGARVCRTGTDVTIVALGPMVAIALEAAATLDDAGPDGDPISVEVIDPRWLAPLDMSAILGSIEKTGRLVVVHEGNVTGGFGAEIAARVATDGLGHLDAPIRRVGVPDCRIPSAPHLQAALRPDAPRLAAAVREVAEW